MTQPKIILGIETSCDETAAAVVQKVRNKITILSNIVASSAKLQEKYGGVIPEQAAREQIKSIIPVTCEALNEARVTSNEIDAIAVTEGPGLIGSLLVGVETAKVLSLVWNKPLVPVNHLLGHFYANWIIEHHLGGGVPQFPCIGLLVSGGHTDLILMTGHGKYQYLGGTRDDAAGECFDKCARLLGLPYPGGPAIAKLASQGDALQLNVPRPMINSKDFDFSFSGLKTAVANLLHTPEESKPTSGVNNNLAASIQQAIIDVLITKTIQAVQKYKVKNLIIAGGVAANQNLAKQLIAYILQKKLDVRSFIPKPMLCTDNAVCIAVAAFFNYYPIKPIKLQANPNLSLSDILILYG